MEIQAQAQTKGIRHYIPILTWLPIYQRDWLRSDIIAGLTIMALLVPEGMAYAELAGMPPQTAFYAAPIGLILFGIFGSSRQLVVAVSATVSVMSLSIVSGLVPVGTAEFITLTAALAILAGLVALLAGISDTAYDQCYRTETTDEILGAEDVFRETDVLGESVLAAQEAAQIWLDVLAEADRQVGESAYDTGNDSND